MSWVGPYNLLGEARKGKGSTKEKRVIAYMKSPCPVQKVTGESGDGGHLKFTHLGIPPTPPSQNNVCMGGTHLES